MPGGYEWLIIIGVLVLLFGAKRLPDMARSVGQSARVFKGEMKGLKADGKDGGKQDSAAEPPVAAAPAPLPPAQPVTVTQPVTQPVAPPVAQEPAKVTQPGSPNAGQ